MSGLTGRAATLEEARAQAETIQRYWAAEHRPIPDLWLVRLAGGWTVRSRMVGGLPPPGSRGRIVIVEATDEEAEAEEDAATG